MNQIKDKLDDSWNDKVDSFITLDLPDIVKLDLIKFRFFNPYAKVVIHKGNKKPRDYQEIAIQNLKTITIDIFSMATGTGKH